LLSVGSPYQSLRTLALLSVTKTWSEYVGIATGAAPRRVRGSAVSPVFWAARTATPNAISLVEQRRVWLT